MYQVGVPPTKNQETRDEMQESRDKKKETKSG